MNLLITYTHHSELQVITELLLTSTLYQSLHSKSSPACSVPKSLPTLRRYCPANCLANRTLIDCQLNYSALFSASLAELDSTDNPQLDSAKSKSKLY
jgi:hypothetical protein